MVTALACSTRIVEKVMGPPLRGLVHSTFAAAANVAFAGGFLLSLNALPHSTSNLHIEMDSNGSGPLLSEERGTDHVLSKESPVEKATTLSASPLPLMPNGLLLSARKGTFPFANLRPGMPVILGAGWLVIEAVSCSLDCTGCACWDPHIHRPTHLNIEEIRANGLWLARRYTNEESKWMPEFGNDETPLALAERLCGRGPGLTPGGDDFLAGWLAAGWLLYGPQAAFLADCQCVLEIARRRTHTLSQCWLAYAAAGDVARPVCELLAALTSPDRVRLEHAARELLALGATSGFDLLQGILYSITQYPAFGFPKDSL